MIEGMVSEIRCKLTKEDLYNLKLKSENIFDIDENGAIIIKLSSSIEISELKSVMSDYAELTNEFFNKIFNQNINQKKAEYYQHINYSEKESNKNQIMELIFKHLSGEFKYYDVIKLLHSLNLHFRRGTVSYALQELKYQGKILRIGNSTTSGVWKINQKNINHEIKTKDDKKRISENQIMELILKHISGEFKYYDVIKLLDSLKLDYNQKVVSNALQKLKHQGKISWNPVGKSKTREGVWKINQI